MPWEINLRLDEAKQEFDTAALEALSETFNLDILPEAKALAPVSKTEPDAGRLRDSIQVEVVQGENGPKAKIFTDCGYGGYVELGIKGKGGPGRKGGKRHHMQAQPYATPAFMHGIRNYKVRLKNKVAAVSLEAAQKEMRERNSNG